MWSLVFPEEWELLSFFESEPELLDPEAPWLYNALTFRRAQADESLMCIFSPSYGDLVLRWMQHDSLRLQLDLHDIVRVELFKDHDVEWLRCTFNPLISVQDLLLAVKPHVRILWGT